MKILHQIPILCDVIWSTKYDTFILMYYYNLVVK